MQVITRFLSIFVVNLETYLKVLLNYCDVFNFRSKKPYILSEISTVSKEDVHNSNPSTSTNEL